MEATVILWFTRGWPPSRLGVARLYFFAALMLAGVRVGGSPFWPTEFRWGYGWPWPRFYGPLDAEEKALVEDALRIEMAN